MKFAALWVFAALCLAGCASDSGGQDERGDAVHRDVLCKIERCRWAPTDEEKAAAVEVTYSCFRQYIPTLDDKTSPASVVADGVAQACSAALDAEATLYGRAENKIVRREIWGALHSGRLIVPVVLAYRTTGVISKRLPAASDFQPARRPLSRAESL